ncbi:MAG: DUF4157 domain-containing protein, partial [Alphaproteobacteria bacterium]
MPVKTPAVPNAVPEPVRLVQRKCACGGDGGLAGECAGCRKNKLIGGALQTKLKLNQPGDAFEREADLAADRVMRMSGAPSGSGGPPSNSAPRLQRRPAAPDAAGGAAPPIVAEALGSPGVPLDGGTRGFFESRFGYDFGKIRIHNDARAAESAEAIHALAYTSGHELVFAAGQYAPASGAGRRLLAHELAHAVQQGEAAPTADVQRQCTAGASCSQPICGDPGAFNAGESTAEAAARSARAQQVQQDPAAVAASGHGRRAVNLEAVAAANGVSLAAVHGIFVDLDMSPGTGAITTRCRSFVGFVPPYSGPRGADCIFVPDNTETEAAVANGTPAPALVGGRPRRQWLQETLQIITHELQHVRFDAASHSAVGGGTCTRSTVVFTAANGDRFDVDFYLSELSAILAEFVHVFDFVRRRTPGGDYGQLLTNLSRDYRDEITNCSESISGILTALRCQCPCGDVDAF